METVITGDTLSVILFSSTINVIVRSAEKPCKGPVIKLGIRQSPVKAFIDNLTIANTYSVKTRWLFKALEEITQKARMKFNAKKSRCMVL